MKEAADKDPAMVLRPRTAQGRALMQYVTGPHVRHGIAYFACSMCKRHFPRDRETIHKLTLHCKARHPDTYATLSTNNNNNNNGTDDNIGMAEDTPTLPLPAPHETATVTNGEGDATPQLQHTKPLSGGPNAIVPGEADGECGRPNEKEVAWNAEHSSARQTSRDASTEAHRAENDALMEYLAGPFERSKRSPQHWKCNLCGSRILISPHTTLLQEARSHFQWKHEGTLVRLRGNISCEATHHAPLLDAAATTQSQECSSGFTTANENSCIDNAVSPSFPIAGQLHPLARNAEEHLCYTAAADRMARLFATKLVPYGTMREERFEPLRGVVRDEAEMSALTAAAVRVELERFAESCHHHNVTISMDFTEAAPPAADTTTPGHVAELGASLSVAATCEGRSRLLLYGRRLLRWREPCDALAAEIVGVVEEAVAAFVSVRAAAVAAGGEARPALSFVSNGEAAAARLACRVMGERHHGLSSFCFRALLDGLCRRIAAAELPRLGSVLRGTAAGDAALSVLLGLSGERVVVDANGVAAEYMLTRRRRPLVEALRHAGDASRRDTLSIVDTVTVRGALVTLQPLEEALRAIAAPGTNVGAACCALGAATEQLSATQLEALHAYRFALCAPTVVSAAGLCAGVEYGELDELHQALVGAKVGNVALLVAGCTPFSFDAAGRGVRMPSWNCPAVSATVMAEVRRRLSEHCASCVDVERTWIDALPPHAKMRLACGDTEILEQLPLFCCSMHYADNDGCIAAFHDFENSFDVAPPSIWRLLDLVRTMEFLCDGY